jgi:hypothetical protein
MPLRYIEEKCISLNYKGYEILQRNDHYQIRINWEYLQSFYFFEWLDNSERRKDRIRFNTLCDCVLYIEKFL